MRGSAELSTTSASKSVLVCVKTESSQRSASERHPWRTVSTVTARPAGRGSLLRGAVIACSSLPSAVSTTSHPPSRSCSRIASAAEKSRTRRRSTRSSSSLWAAALSVLFGFDRGGQRGHYLQRVADHPKVGHLHDRRLSVLVDRDDHLRRLHPHRVLHRARYSDRDVDARPHRFAGLPDLHRIRHPPGVDHRAACPHRPAKGAGEVFQQREVL